MQTQFQFTSEPNSGIIDTDAMTTEEERYRFAWRFRPGFCREFFATGGATIRSSTKTVKREGEYVVFTSPYIPDLRIKYRASRAGACDLYYAYRMYARAVISELERDLHGEPIPPEVSHFMKTAELPPKIMQFLERHALGERRKAA
jgi:hypothetical protein